MLKEIQRLADALKESQATILRAALRAGLPTVSQQAPMPYDPHLYDDYPQERIDLEEATAKAWGGPDRTANEAIRDLEGQAA